MEKKTDSMSVADLLGPWVDPDLNSGLIQRCRKAWNKPIRDLSNQELITLLLQRIAVEQILPIAKKKVEDNVDDGTEMYDGELRAAIEYASKNI
jgi:hypothetical protein